MIIFDEYKHAEKMLLSGFQTNRSGKFELQLLATYFREQGLNDKEIENELHAFCKKFANNYNWAQYYELVDQKVRKSKRYKLKRAKPIVITKAELDTITAEENLKCQKLMFVYLVLAKYYMNNNQTTDYYVGVKDNEIYNLCDMYVKKQEKLDLMHYLTKKGYIKPTLSMSSIVKYVNENSEQAIVLVPDTDMIHYYEKYLGYYTTECPICGRLIRKKTNRTKYCTQCAQLVKNKKIKS